MIYKMTLKDSVDTMTFNLLETPIVDKDIEGAVDNVTLDGNQYTDYLYLKKQYIQKWAIMCPDEYDELRGFYTRQFEDGEVPSYRVYYGANVTRDYTFNGDYFQFNAEGIETGMTLSQLLGNAEQTTYSGKNLASLQTSSAITIGGVSYTITDGVIHANGTTANGGNFYFDKFRVRSGNATLWLEVTGYNDATSGSNTAFVLQESSDGSTWEAASNGSIGWTSTASKTRAITLDSSKYYRMRLFVDAGNKYTNAAAKIQLEYGDKTTFEPYVGGTASPNPDYPQEIETVTGEQTVKITGKNLMPFTSQDFIIRNVRYYVQDGSLYIDGTSTGETSSADAQFKTNFAFTLPAGTYTASHKTGLSGVTGYIKKQSDNSNLATLRANEATANFTLAESTAVYLGFYVYQASNSNVNTDIQLELGNQATAYEPYQGQSYKVNLGKNLCSSGSYFNANTIALNVQSGMIIPQTFTASFISDTAVSGVSAGLTVNGSPVATLVNNINISASQRTTMTATIQDSVYSTLKPSDTVLVSFYKSGSGYDTSHTLGEPQIEAGSTATSYAPYFTPIELAKVGTYQDRIYKEDGKWYIEKNVGKLNMADITGWSDRSAGDLYLLNFSTTYNAVIAECISNIFTYSATTWAGAGKFGIAPSKTLWIMTSDTSVNATNISSWLANKNAVMYYALATPTTTEITDETLLSQLNFLASLYEGANNISLVGTGAQGEMEVFIRDVMSVETDVVPEVPVRLTLTDDGVINACGCRRNVQLTMRETTE